MSSDTDTKLTMAEEPGELIRDLSSGGVLDNSKLERIENNTFILKDGKLPVCCVMIRYL